jgi:hypothetical protein
MFNVPPLDPSKVCLFDMDETLADFTGPLRERLLETLGPNEKMPDNLWDMPDHMYLRTQAIKRTPGFWKNLPKKEWGWQVLEISREVGFTPVILTKRPTTGNLAVYEKLEWLDKYLPGVIVNVVDDKRLIYGRVFVDDYWPFMQVWLENRPRGLGVVNYTSDLHPNLVSILDGEDEVRRRLVEAYQR